MQLDRRFYDNIRVDKNGCWIWMGCKRRGYGRLTRNHKWFNAHRYSYEMHVGKIPTDRLCLHRCDVKACVNPNHLYLGDAFDNARDAVERGRLGDRKGENSNRAKLKAFQVLEIKQKRKQGMKLKEIAGEYGFSISGIYHILDNTNWKCLEEQR